MKVSKARKVLLDFYLHKLHFRIDIKKSAISKIENEGIVIIDEIDKIAGANVLLLINSVQYHKWKESKCGGCST